MAKSKIPWTDEVWNPIRGCSPESIGCSECYACRMAGRFCGPGKPYEGLVRRTSTGWKWTGEVRLLPEKLEDPLRWKEPRRVFVNSMADLFHAKVPDEFIYQVWKTMTIAMRHTFQVLTKRAVRMEQWFGSDAGEKAREFAASQGREWPLNNVWVGASMENQDAVDKRAPALLGCPAWIRYVSCEPLLGKINISAHLSGGIHQVIAGCQTGPKLRIYEMKEDWVRSLRDQCQKYGAAFFYKQKLNEDGIRVSMPFLDDRQWGEYPDDRSL